MALLACSWRPPVLDHPPATGFPAWMAHAARHPLMSAHQRKRGMALVVEFSRLPAGGCVTFGAVGLAANAGGELPLMWIRMAGRANLRRAGKCDQTAGPQNRRLMTPAAPGPPMLAGQAEVCAIVVKGAGFAP